MVVDVISFYLPHNSGTSIIFKTSILLGYTVFRVNLMDEMPVTTIRTPLMGVFFAVCMALLVLKLAISIFVVKLLYHNEKEVKEMSVSGCLLDKYGSSSQTFLESNFTSVKTLNDVDQSTEYLHFGHSCVQPHHNPTHMLSLQALRLTCPRRVLLESILQEVVALRLYLQEGESDDSAQADWVALCCKVDLLLFRVYLLILVVYTSTLLLLWAIWSSA
uniref:5-hydroxytryptamine receptor 3B n=1 Tax=Oncorhynchus kisutch TaxID=8019 RepID=A0A8C7IUH7_ONCKI